MFSIIIFSKLFFIISKKLKFCSFFRWRMIYARRLRARVLTPSRSGSAMRWTIRIGICVSSWRKCLKFCKDTSGTDLRETFCFFLSFVPCSHLTFTDGFYVLSASLNLNFLMFFQKFQIFKKTYLPFPDPSLSLSLAWVSKAKHCKITW